MATFSFQFDFHVPQQHNDEIDAEGREVTTTSTGVVSEPIISINYTAPSAADISHCCEVRCPAFLSRAIDTFEYETLDVSQDTVFRKLVLRCSPDIATATGAIVATEGTDLIPGVYEGGFKVWECSIDISRILCDAFNGVMSYPPRTMLELGCGTAIPGIIAMMKHDSISEAVLTDFNKDVLERATWPHVLLNLPVEKHSRVQCIAGDWIAASQTPDLLQGRSFDLILSAETLYNRECCIKLFRMIEQHLEPNGVAIVASKRYYFGVGGGTFDMINLCSLPASSLQLERLTFYEDAQSNIRDVLKLTKK